jgi:hypothetical protein
MIEAIMEMILYIVVGVSENVYKKQGCVQGCVVTISLLALALTSMFILIGLWSMNHLYAVLFVLLAIVLPAAIRYVKVFKPSSSRERLE